MPMQLWLCPLLAFLLGSIPFGLIISRAKGVNIRAHGSGNIGATNVLRVVGKPYGIACLLLDMLKGFVPVVIAVNLIRIDGRPAQIPVGIPEGWALVLPAVSVARPGPVAPEEPRATTVTRADSASTAWISALSV